MCGVMSAVPKFNKNMYLPLHLYFLKVLMLPDTTMRGITERARWTE